MSSLSLEKWYVDALGLVYASGGVDFLSDQGTPLVVAGVVVVKRDDEMGKGPVVLHDLSWFLHIEIELLRVGGYR